MPRPRPLTRFVIGSLAWGIAIATLTLAGCAPKEGGSCDEGAIACVDPQTKLFCKDGKYVAMPCKGKDGCKEADGQLLCDVSGNAAGDTCAKANEGQGRCRADGKAQVLCVDEKFAIVACEGPDGCKTEGDKSTCDFSVATVGAVCHTDVAGCTADKKQMLGCKDEKWAAKAQCRGKQGCRREGDKIACDQSIGAVGDSCGGSACSEDGKMMLSCQDKKLAPGIACRGPKGCRRDGKDVRCDQSLGKVGETCQGGGAACSEDGKTLIKCTDGKWEGVRKCRVKGCRTEGKKVLCG